MPKIREFPGWCSIPKASRKYKRSEPKLRELVKNGVLTGRKFLGEAPSSPLYLRIPELDALNSGGVEAAKRLKEAWDKSELLEFETKKSK